MIRLTELHAVIGIWKHQSNFMFLLLSCFISLLILQTGTVECKDSQLAVVVMRTVLFGLKKDGKGKLHAAFSDHADDPAGLVPRNFLFHPILV